MNKIPNEEKLMSSMERIGELERAYVLEVIDSGFRTSSGGMMTKRLEAAFAERFNSRYAISFVNGTATMHAALVAAGIGPGDEVIVPPLTMASTSFAVLHAGAVPVFADIEPTTWTLDPRKVRELIGPKTCAVIPVALYGMSADMDPLMFSWELQGASGWKPRACLKLQLPKQQASYER
jgi:perosamine synthetase